MRVVSLARDSCQEQRRVLVIEAIALISCWPSATCGRYNFVETCATSINVWSKATVLLGCSVADEKVLPPLLLAGQIGPSTKEKSVISSPLSRIWVFFDDVAIGLVVGAVPVTPLQRSVSCSRKDSIR